MTFAAVLNALAIPREAAVEQRVPKKLLTEQGAPTAADKRRIQDGIEEMTWVAALKPTNIGVPAYKDQFREYLEIVVLTATLRPLTKPPRLVELIHRAIPYPAILITGHAEAITLSLAHKRWSQGEVGKTVLENVRNAVLNASDRAPEEILFLESLAISRLPAGNLFALYEGLLERITALEAARITGAFAAPESPEHAAALQQGLGAHARITRELSILRAKSRQEKQLNRRVEVNLEIKRLEAELAATQKAL